MTDSNGYIDKNRELWNIRTGIHVDSDFYDVKGFLAGKSTINEIEATLLGDVSGNTVLHLQCHFGQDSISLARQGAIVTGVDLSDKAIDKARELAVETNVNAEFICSDIYDLDRHLDKQFDIVFTSYGTIAWLPDLDKWARLISKMLKKGGRFVMAEFHPLVWMFDNDFAKITYPYFKSDAIVEVETGTYAEPSAPIKTESVTWNHGLAEVITSLLKQGLQIETLSEFDYSPYNCFKDMEQFEANKFRIKTFGNKLPLVYSLCAKKS